MDPKTLTALKASIAKWERNVEVETPDEVRLGAHNCPLCDLFWAYNCQGCPVKDFTEAIGCEETPYDKTVNAFEFWKKEPSPRRKRSWREAAQAEVDFLKSLLPEGEQS